MSVLEDLYLAGRTAVMGRLLRDPVLMLAAEQLAAQAGLTTITAPRIRSAAAEPGAPPEGPLADARIAIDALRADALRYADDEACLVRELIVQRMGKGSVRGRARMWRGTIPARTTHSFTLDLGHEAVLLGDGQAPLSLEALDPGALVSQDAAPVTTYLCWQGQAMGLRLTNHGKSVAGYVILVEAGAS